MVMIIIPVTNRNLSIWLLLSLLTDLWSNKNRSCYKSWVVEQKLKISIKIVGSGVGEKRNGCQGLTESFPSSVRFRLRRHPNRVRLTRSNVIRRNTPSLLSLSLSLSYLFCPSSWWQPSRCSSRRERFHPRIVGHVEFTSSLPSQRNELRHGRTELGSCLPCSRCTMLVLMDAFTRFYRVTRVYAGCKQHPSWLSIRPPSSRPKLLFHLVLPFTVPFYLLSSFSYVHDDSQSPLQPLRRWRRSLLPLVFWQRVTRFGRGVGKLPRVPQTSNGLLDIFFPFISMTWFEGSRSSLGNRTSGVMTTGPDETE